MDAITVTMDFPRDILLAADISEINVQSDIRKHLALYMFKERILSFGKSVELSGMNKMEFMELAGSKSISLNYDADDYREDLMTIIENLLPDDEAMPDDFDEPLDVMDASMSSTDFWDNEVDDKIWNSQ
ncbi:MAG: UPF0175 family protein [Defluviitaleaceae bacterium]|nr:UPF0175 family protein [Defluviitaleaceae bacterium]